jgi:4-hydroxy-tetrahydrodipicolinate synthase
MLIAAVATPVRDDGQLDLATLDRVLDFLAAAGVDGVCVGGATSEYPHFEVAERASVVRRAASRLGGARPLFVGIGASSTARTIELGRVAAAAGSSALLLPMPMFFRYDQEDLRAYCAHVSGIIRARCLLYDLPDFTNALAPQTAVALMRGEEFIAGIKDSGGRVENLAAFALERADSGWTLLVGDDRLLLQGLDAGWDGAISGLAGFCPELLVRLAQSVARGDREEAARSQQLVGELATRVAQLPTPWGIRLGLAARGIETGPLPLPVSESRRRQAVAFQEWFTAWLPQALR